MASRLPDARSATWVTCLLSTAATGAVLWATDSALDFNSRSLLLIAASTLFLLVLHVVYTRLRPEPLLSAATGGVAAISCGGLLAAILALTALRTNAPLIDPVLARADAALNLFTPALVASVAQQPLSASILQVAYLATVPWVFGTALLLAATGRVTEMWTLCFCFTTTAVFCALFSAFAPAAGAFAYYGTEPEVLLALPDHAGLFHLDVFEKYRAAHQSLVDFGDANGVVTFPSFHAAMALMCAHALRDYRGLSMLAWLWCVITLVATVPIGGHYAVDLIAGAAVWAAFAWLAHTLTAQPRQNNVPAGVPA
jgi:membrane-associated phospholipid phosphatase